MYTIIIIFYSQVKTSLFKILNSNVPSYQVDEGLTDGMISQVKLTVTDV